ncbi:acyl-CoA N-acyltransferase [Kockovaella imperatae]|uniref:Acyl-CoA N-acyltransferase n=1 Tax=Kockovaella imperatae TaxID=4999 RepID=A0A1Y1UK45_9TREE|nr:acyl-CoA N-acyltransferase [Kockovaella imperatae]ORX37836.1 acyl-CoA N-acyltransferase [Kockovaella imperatae]
MPFKLLPLTEEDAPECVSVYFAAFQNPHSLACWPRVPAIRSFWEKMILDELHEPRAHWAKAVDEETGRLAGFMKWQAPKEGVEPDTRLPEWPAEADGRLCDETFGAWARQHRDLMGSRGHWYLELIAVHPDYQGRGAGSLMMRYGTERADSDHTEAFLEASPDAVALYEKFGFREASRLDTFIENERVEGVWYRNLFMIRPIRSTSDKS